MVIGISGMIGCGKSTLSQSLHKHYKNSILLEEFEKDDAVFNTFLRWFYQNQPNINIGFQAYIVESLSDNFKKTVKKFKDKGWTFKNNHIFLDRFNLEHYIFAILTLKEKPKKYFEAFDALFNEILDHDDDPDLAIFIDVDFETFKDRIFARGRKEEIDNWKANEAYFKELHSLYKKLFVELLNKYHIPYVIIDSNKMNDKEVLSKAIEIIDNYDFSKSKRINQ